MNLRAPHRKIPMFSESSDALPLSPGVARRVHSGERRRPECTVAHAARPTHRSRYALVDEGLEVRQQALASPFADQQGPCGIEPDKQHFGTPHPLPYSSGSRRSGAASIYWHDPKWRTTDDLRQVVKPLMVKGRIAYARAGGTPADNPISPRQVAHADPQARACFERPVRRRRQAEQVRCRMRRDA